MTTAVVRGVVPVSALREFYVTQPTPEMDPDDLRTELNWPLDG